jgi:hypothetical protein
MLPSLLFMLPIVVVDVGADRLDPAHTRSLVGKELEVEAVAPDDPRAAQATGRVDVVEKDGKLTVRYRKVDGPIERSIPVAPDPARAESDAAYLAGNLARDEASELTPKAPEKPAVPVTEKGSPWGEDDHRYAQLRAYVTDLSDDARSTSVRSGALLATAGALLLTPGIYVAAKGDLDEPNGGGIAIASFVTGGVFLTIGAIAMIAKSDPYEALAKTVREQDAKKASSEDAIAAVETEWKSQVASEQSARRTSAILSFVLAGLSIGTASVLLATGEDIDPGLTTYIMAGGALNVITGVAAILSEGPMERAYRQWHAVSNADVPKIGFGIAPAVGGGSAAFSIRF